MISPQLQPIIDELDKSYVMGEDYNHLGTQVLWVWRNGALAKRYIAGTSTLSQHVGGNARDVGPRSQSAADIAVIDEMVEVARAKGAKVLWRGVRNHYPHHAHIEGVPRYTQAQLEAFYDDTEEQDMKELIANIQRALIIAGYDLGTFTPLSPEYPAGADGDWGAKTDAAFVVAMTATVDGVASLPTEHTHPVPVHKHGVEWPPMTDMVTGVPI